MKFDELLESEREELDEMLPVNEQLDESVKTFAAKIAASTIAGAALGGAAGGPAGAVVGAKLGLASTLTLDAFLGLRKLFNRAKLKLSNRDMRKEKAKLAKELAHNKKMIEKEINSTKDPEEKRKKAKALGKLVRDYNETIEGLDSLIKSNKVELRTKWA